MKWLFSSEVTVNNPRIRGNILEKWTRVKAFKELQIIERGDSTKRDNVKER